MKKYTKKKRRKKHYILKAVLLLGFIAGAYYFISSDYFNVDAFTVEGNKHYTDQQIIDIAKTASGRNIFALPTADIKDKLLEDPYIKSARIAKKLPGEIVIFISERSEAAAVPYGESFIVIDGEGIVLRYADAEPDLTVFTGMTLTNINSGSRLEAEDDSMFSTTLELIQIMKERDLYFPRVDFLKSNIKVYIYDALVCEGLPENILKSMDGLEDVLYDLHIQGIERGVIKVGGNGYFSFSALVE